MVKHPKPFTGTGDRGTTTTAKGRVSKDSLVVEALGEIDELVASLGLAKVALRPYKDLYELVGELQRTLFRFAAVIHGMRGYEITDSDVRWLEDVAIRYDSQLPPLRQFIIPGGSEEASRLHLARTISRRAERKVVALSRARSVDQQCLAFINRMSSLLFVLARYVNFKKSVDEEKL